MTSPNDKNVRGKSNRWYWVLLILVIIGSVVIRGRLLTVPLERDEGEYAYIGQQLLRGVPPYASGYSMKLPGIYVVYAGIMAVFGETITGIHAGLAVFNAAMVVVIFLLTRRMFGGLAGAAAGCAYAILSLLGPVQGVFANAEHFVILPALIGIFLISGRRERLNPVSIFIAGLFLGFAFIIKQHGVFFGVFGAGYLLYCDVRRRPIQWTGAVLNQLVFVTGAAMSFAIVCFLYWRIGMFDKFWFLTFTYAREYTNVIPIYAAWELLGLTIKPIIAYSFLIWIFALGGLLRVIFRTSDREHLPFVAGFLVFSFLTVCPGFYFRGHYFVLFFPSVAVLAGAGFAWLVKLLPCKIAPFNRGLITALAGLVIIGFSLFQQRLYLFSISPNDICHLFYGGSPFPESLEAARFIRDNGAESDTVAVIGSEPQIYFYLGRRAVTHYIYTYFLMWDRKYGGEMQREMIDEIESAKPQWMVFVGSQTSWTRLEHSITHIFEWFDEYSKNHYDAVGIIEVHPFRDSQPVYRWNEQAKNYAPQTEDWLAVYKRKSD